MEQPLNQILFGPPGTGKTYNTIYKALDILEPRPNNMKWAEDLQGKTKEGHRKMAKDKFDEYVASGRIVFTTFHQSMSYEDFVEGIKPSTVKGAITYKPEPGVFKTIAEKASKIKLKDFYDSIVRDIQNSVSQSIDLPQKKGKDVKITEKEGVLYFNKSTSGSVKFEAVEALVIEHPTTEELKNNNNDSRNIESPKGNDTKLGGDVSALWAVAHEVLRRKEMGYIPFVLIIDEINRGNVANIFGELITLIEEDKRIGNPEETKVTLPYSKDSEEKFGVPNNLYIIGTMNTADRSVEALDSALRRRFTFKEMMPEPELLKDVKISGVDCVDANGKKHDATLADFLYTINRRIEVLKDREHQIGHSYFMQFVDNQPKTIQADALKDVIYKKVIPLLQEYFYGDYEKIQLVLGKDFVNIVSIPGFPKGLSYSAGANLYKIEDSKNVNFMTALNDMDLMQCP